MQEIQEARPVHSFTERIVGAAKLDVDIYEEVEADRTGGALGQAFLVVLMASIAAGVGIALAAVIEDDVEHLARKVVIGLIAGAIWTVIAWLIWSGLSYVIGVSLFKGPETKTDYGELLRTLGFAHTPGIIRILYFVPWVGPLIYLAASVWMLIASVIAIRQALDFTTWRAIGTVIVGWLVLVVVGLILGAYVGLPGF